MPAGRPTKYHDRMPELVQEYLDTYKDNQQVIPTVAGLSLHLGVSRDTVHEWSRDENKHEFSDMVKNLLSEQEIICANQGITGEFNATISKLILCKHGYSDKVVQEHKGEIPVKLTEQDTRL